MAEKRESNKQKELVRLVLQYMLEEVCERFLKRFSKIPFELFKNQSVTKKFK